MIKIIILKPIKIKGNLTTSVSPVEIVSLWKADVELDSEEMPGLLYQS